MSTTFNLIAAPSCSRPQISVDRFREDALQVKELMGACGVAGFTEIVRGGIKAEFASIFGHHVGLKGSDSPIVWTRDWTYLAGGVDFGCAGIPIVAPARHTSWALLQRNHFVLGVWFTHMAPGGFAPHPSSAQAHDRSLIQSRWERHDRRIQHRINMLVRHASAVVGGGDINHPGLTTWNHQERLTGPGLIYLGATPGLQHGATRPHQQRADHPAEAVVVSAA